MSSDTPLPHKALSGFVSPSYSNDLVDTQTGEQHNHALIHTLKVVDNQNFVKVFTEGVRKAFELNKTEMRVFCKVLEIYEQERMTGGYADSITLCCCPSCSSLSCSVSLLRRYSVMKATRSPLKNNVGLIQNDPRSFGLKNPLLSNPFSPLLKSLPRELEKHSN
jgi:hypothetical protein